jgi:metal-dependent amidase/aminoacylase/carboxypeptidase family protein
MRAYSESTRARIKKRMEEMVKAQAKSVGVKAKIAFTGGCPTLKNDQELTALAKECAGKLFPEKQVVLTNGRGGGSEDFAYISQQIPSVFIVMSAGELAQGKKWLLKGTSRHFVELHAVFYRGVDYFVKLTLGHGARLFCVYVLARLHTPHGFFCL